MNAKVTATVATIIVATMVLVGAGAYTYAWFSDSDETPVSITTAYIGVDNSLDGVNLANWTSGGLYTEDYELTNNSTTDIVYMSYIELTITDGTAAEPVSTLADRVNDFKAGFKVNDATIFSNNTVEAGQTSYTLNGTVTGWTIWAYSTDAADMVKDGTLTFYYGGSGAQDLVIEGYLIVDAYQSDYPYNQESVELTSGTVTIGAANLAGSNLVVSGNVADAQGTGSSVPVSINFDAASLTGINAGTTVTITDSEVNNIVVNDGSSVIAAVDVTIIGSSSQLSGTATVTMTVAGNITNPVVYNYDNGTSTRMTIKDVQYDAASNMTTVVFVTNHFSTYYIANEVADATVWDGSIAALPIDTTSMQATIDTAAELAGLAYAVNNGSSLQGYTVLLAADIDLANLSWTPIGGPSAMFKGTFDGQGHTISNLYVDVDDHAGLFGLLYGSASNLDIVDATIAGGQYVGALAGESGYYSVITDVDVTGFTITGYHFVGGVVGFFQGKITYCDVAGTSDDVSTITVTPNAVSGGYDNGDKVGGIIGYLQNNAGGLGFGYVVNDNTVSYVDITAYRDVGGVAGAVAQASANFPPTVSDNTVSNVTITVDQYTNSYGYMVPNAGAVVGRIVNPNYFALDTTNTVTDVTIDQWFDAGSKVLQISDAEKFQAFATFVNTGYDFTGWNVLLTADIDLSGIDWTPIGTAINFADGISGAPTKSGTPAGSFQSTYFNGTFDGQGHTVSNMNVTSDYCAGLFGAVYNGTIRNLIIDNAAVTSVYDATVITNDSYSASAGAVVGLALLSTIDDVTVSGSTITGYHFVGGIVGYMNDTIVTDCTVSGSTITATPNAIIGGYDNGDKVGGITGFIIKGYYSALDSNTVSGNTVTNTSVNAYRDIGGVIGCISSATCTVTDNTVSGVSIAVDQTVNGYGYKMPNIGNVIGRSITDVITLSGNQVSNVIMTVKVLVANDSDLSTIVGACNGVSVTAVLKNDIIYDNDPVNIVTDVTIDLAGNTLTITNATLLRPFVMNDGSSLTVIGTAAGSTVNYTNGGFVDTLAVTCEAQGFSITLNGGTYIGDADNTTASALVKIRNTTGAVTLDMTDVTYEDQSATSCVVDLSSVSMDLNLVMNVTGGQYTGDFGFYTLGTATFDGVTINTKGAAFNIMGDTTITDCTVTVVTAPSGGIAVSSGGVATVDGGSISGNMDAVYYVYSTGGDITATGVDVTGADYTDFVAITYNGSTVTVDGNVYTQTTATPAAA